MKILKIKLVNFQSYKNEEFQMNDVMVILRENGAGKSAFLKALNFALCGEGCDDGEIMQGEKEMSVSILFENGLTVERKRKRGDRTIVHRMGYEKTKKSRDRNDRSCPCLPMYDADIHALQRVRKRKSVPVCLGIKVSCVPENGVQLSSAGESNRISVPGCKADL